MTDVRTDKSKLLFRRTTEYDTPKVLALDVKCRTELCAPEYPPGVYENWREAITEATYQEPIANELPSFVAELDADIVGYANVGDNDLRNICVHPSYLRMGIGTTLFNYVEFAVKRAGYARITLLSTTNAIPFFDAVGCKSTKRTQMYIEGGVLINVVEFEKRPLDAGSLRSPNARL